jgi:hypothetical protein
LLIPILIGDVPAPKLAVEVFNIASSIAAGKGFSNAYGPDTGPTAHTTPIYPLFLAAAIKLCGEAVDTVMWWISGA